MEVFISWSGEESHRIALVLKDWLPSVVQSVSPFVSSEDISKGKLWSQEMIRRLVTADAGILCVTPSNVGAPWLNFEAGALYRADKASSAMALLFGLTPSQVDGPLSLFQMTRYEKDDVWRLVTSLNSTSSDGGVIDPVLRKTFDALWPELDAKLSPVESTAGIVTSTETGPPLTRVENRVFRLQVLTLDNQEFVACEFRDCSLIYAGGPCGLVGNTFVHTNFQFAGAAVATIKFLELLYRNGGGFNELVEATFQAIREGSYTGRENKAPAARDDKVTADSDDVAPPS